MSLLAQHRGTISSMAMQTPRTRLKPMIANLYLKWFKRFTNADRVDPILVSFGAVFTMSLKRPQNGTLPSCKRCISD